MVQTDLSDDRPRRGELIPEGHRDTRFAFSRIGLAFTREGVEERYLAYRNPRILRYLRVLLGFGAVMVFGGSIIDFRREDTEATTLLTIIRVCASFGMIAAIFLTYRDWVRENLQKFIGAGTVAIHVIWLATVPIVKDGIYDYLGVLPINIMLTFLVSGLMFRYAIWVAGAAAIAYALAIDGYLDKSLAPVFYMLAAGLYSGFAAFVAERARREAWADAQALDAERERTEVERQRSETLLLNVLPSEIAARKKDGEELIADRVEDACVLFADICGFTEMSSGMEPEDLVDILDEIFKRFDEIAAVHDLEKIKTIGDCYMMAAGLPKGRASDSAAMAAAALEMLEALREISRAKGIELDIRVGIHCGPVVAGVIGKSKFIYDLWGDTVNVASRMESTADQGSIQVSEAMYERLAGDFVLEDLGRKKMKGKDMLPVYRLCGRK